MAILYQLPRIGEQSPNKWGQRGPTCWYYVSKMLLKFHNKIQPASEYYERFKAMHELRRILTEMGENEARANRHDKSIVVQRLEAASMAQLRRINSRAAALTEVSRKLRTAQGQAAVRLRAHLEKLQELMAQDRVEMGRKGEAIEALKAYEDNDLSRAKIFESFFPDGTFTIVQEDVWLRDGFTAGRLEECLASWGPCYAGGAFSVSAIDRGGNDAAVGGDRIVNVNDFRRGSAHAIVIAGIDGERVFYKDPNHSDELATCSFEHLRANISTSDNRLFIAVNCAPDPNTGRCGHMNAGAITRPDSWQ